MNPTKAPVWIERRATLEGLYQAEAVNRAIVESLPRGLFLKDCDSTYLAVNEKYASDFGCARDEIVGKDDFAFCSTEQAEQHRANDQVVVATGQVRETEELRLVQGQEHWIRTTTAPVRGAAGEVTAVLGLLEDVSERKRTERTLLASETRYRRLFESAKDGILILEAGSGRIVDVNPFLIEMTGFSHQDFVGKQLWELGTFQDIAASKSLFAELQDQQYVRYDDLPLQTRAGRTIDVEFVSNVYPVDGDAVIQCNIRDISARKRGETERLKLEEQLRASQKMEAIGSLAGGIAHDFNNLLTVITSYADFAADSLRPSDPIYADIVEIQGAAQRAATMTRQLLAFSRKQILQPKVLNLNKVVTEIESMLRRLLGEDISILVHLDDDLGHVMADPGQIEQVILNLALNARDSMPQGGKLTIETANIELDEEYVDQRGALGSGRFVMISVTDSGHGMDAETQRHIFEPFFTTKRKGKGTGLGLSTVYGIVKQSGGDIWVYSEPGRGTAFKVYLSRTEAPTTEVRRRLSSVIAKGNETVLIVEDEAAVRRLEERILRNAGYEVLVAASGHEAIALCEARGGLIDLLVTDVVMPQMSGRELADQLTDAYPGLKVLYVSGYTDDAIVHHGVLNEGTHFIGKPFSAAALTRRAREVLDEALPRAGRSSA